MVFLEWYSQLSKKQRFRLYGAILIMALIMALGAITERIKKPVQGKSYTIDMSAKEIAPDLNVTGKALLRELDLPVPPKKAGKKKLKELGVSQKKLDQVVAHLLSHKGTMLKYFIFFALFLGGLVFMVKLGRPELSEKKHRKEWYPRAPYLFVLLFSLAVTGFLPW